MASIGSLIASLKLDNSDFNKGVNDSGGRLKSIGKTAGIVGASVVGAGVAAAGALFSITKGAGEAADELLDLSDVTGMSTDEMQRWRGVATKAGVSADAVADASLKLTKSFDSLGKEGSSSNEAIKELGLSFEDLENMDTDDRMDAIIKGLSDVEDGTRRAELGTELFGGKWGEIGPIAGMAGEELDKLKDSANVVDAEDLDQANKFRESLDTLGESASHMMMGIALQAMPTMQKFADFIEDKMPIIEEVVGTFFEFVNNYILKFVEYFEEFALPIIEQFVELFMEGFDLLMDILGDSGDSMEFFYSIFEKIKEYADIFVGIVQEVIIPIIQHLMEVFQENFEGIRDLASNIFDALAVIFDTTIKVISGLWNMFGEDLMNTISIAFDVISGVIGAALDIINGILDVFVGIFTGDFDRFSEGIKGIWEGLWGFVQTILEGAWNLLKAPFDGIVNNITGIFDGLVGSALNWGSNLIGGFVDGIMGSIGKVKDAASKVTGAVGNFLGFSSPADEGEGRYIEDWGSNMIDGFVDGMRDNLHLIDDQLDSGIGNIQDSTRKLQSTKDSENKIIDIDIQNFIGDRQSLLKLYRMIEDVKTDEDDRVGGLTSV